MQVMSELMTKDNGGWTPLMFAYRSGSRRVFFVAMQAFIDRGDGGTRTVRIDQMRAFWRVGREGWRWGSEREGVSLVAVQAFVDRGDGGTRTVMLDKMRAFCE